MAEAVQYIVVRKDLNMPVGKMAAQCCHASLGAVLERKKSFVLNEFTRTKVPDNTTISISDLYDSATYTDHREVALLDTREMRSWLEGRFVKLVVYVKSEQKLLNLSKKLDDLEITNKLIYDAGRTVFNGETTLTCMGCAPIYRDDVPKCLKVLRLLD